MLTSVLVASLTLAAPVPKANSAELKWRFAKGDTCYVKTEVESTGSVNLGGGGGAQTTVSGAEYVYKLTVTAADEKETTLELEFLSCKAGTAAGGGGGVKLDDEAGVAGKTVTVTLDRANKITKLAGANKLGGPGVAAGMLTEEYLRYNLDDLIRAVPGKTLGKGDTYTSESEAKLTDEFIHKRTDRGTVAGTEDGFTKLEVETDQTMTGGANGVSMDLKGEKGKRTVLFDPKAGRVRKVTEEYSMSGTVEIGGGVKGAAPGIRMSMTAKTTSTVTDDKQKGDK